MSVQRLVRRTLFAAAVVVPCGAALYSLSFAQSPAPVGSREGAPLLLAQNAAQPVQRSKYIGWARCDDCHKADLMQRSASPKDLCLLNESAVLDGQDKHALAYERLFTERGQRMLRLLGIEFDIQEKKIGNNVLTTRVFRGEENVQKAKACLSCHSNWQAEEPHPPTNYTDGVRCESCHGPAADWQDPHYKVEWRTTPIAEKEELGMVDVRDPVKRAQQCFSCHIGNAEQGKIVTHEMYAAGHPPLPGIEIESFAAQMPEHWRYLPEKADFQNKQEFLKANFGDLEHDPTNDLPRTKAVVIGGVMALRESIALLTETSARGPESWPELAVFDCAACHHDLKSPSWRQARGYGNRAPGRPIMFEWPTALTELGVRHLNPDEAAYKTAAAALEADLDRLQAVLSRQPFGNPAEIQAAAKPVLARLDGLATELSKSRYRTEDAQRLLTELLELDTDSYPDYHTARQVAWAAKTIASEIRAPYPARNDETFATREATDTVEATTLKNAQDISTYQNWVANVRDPARKQVDDLFGRFELNTYLNLRLPAGKEDEIEDAMVNSLERIANYDAAEFRDRLRRLAAELENLPVRQTAKRREPALR